MTPAESLLALSATPDERAAEAALRPKRLEECIGQGRVRRLRAKTAA